MCGTMEINALMNDCVQKKAVLRSPIDFEFVWNRGAIHRMDMFAYKHIMHIDRIFVHIDTTYTRDAIVFNGTRSLLAGARALNCVILRLVLFAFHCLHACQYSRVVGICYTYYVTTAVWPYRSRFIRRVRIVCVCVLVCV